MSSKLRPRQKLDDIAVTPQYKELVADVVALIKGVRDRLAATGQLEAFDILAAESDRQSPLARKRRTTAKKHLMKGRRK